MSTYQIRRGDSLSAIASRYGTSASVLARQNGITDPNHIEAGRTLRVPERSEPTEPRRPTGHSTADVFEGSPTQAAAQRAAAGQRSEDTPTPFFTQTQRGHGFRPGRRQCFDAASAMARQGGGSVRAPGNRIQVATHDGRNGDIGVDPAAAARGRRYIDQQLAAGRPVVVGVNHATPAGRRNPNVDHITDHFVTVTGRGTDAQGRTYYSFNDPGTRTGADTNPRNRFYVNPSNGMMYRPEGPNQGGTSGYRFEVSMVR
jgi:murein DD-endopeptidase MepM/ murein hydrolase activator NlpD